MSENGNKRLEAVISGQFSLAIFSSSAIVDGRNRLSALTRKVRIVLIRLPQAPTKCSAPRVKNELCMAFDVHDWANLPLPRLLQEFQSLFS